jgi:mono/diheme cytochrome c family protein
MRIAPLLVTITLGAVAGARTGAAQTPAPAPDGAALYQANCRACHGPSGVPPQRMVAIYKELAPLDSAFLAARSEDSLVAALRDGIGKMKGYKEKLTPEQIAAIAKYVKTLAAPATPP